MKLKSKNIANRYRNKSCLEIYDGIKQQSDNFAVV